MGSGPGVLEACSWDRAKTQTFVAINNAWRIRPDWDWLIYPEDFPEQRRPQALKRSQSVATATDYVPIQNEFGGFVYAGGTMAFTAAYWALGALKPDVIAMVGCDMIYPASGKTHFYGNGTADPLRADVTLRSLKAKSARLWALAARSNCAMVNLSSASRSMLLYPKIKYNALCLQNPYAFDGAAVEQALAAEAAANYMVASGRYWEEEAKFDTAAIDKIDQLWIAASRSAKGPSLQRVSNY